MRAYNISNKKAPVELWVEEYTGFNTSFGYSLKITED